MSERTITTTDIIQSAKGRVFEVYSASGKKRRNIKVTEQHGAVLCVRDLYWYESAWLWLRLIPRKILNQLTYWWRSLK